MKRLHALVSALALLAATPGAAAEYVRLTTLWLGDGIALDIVNGGPWHGHPRMAPEAFVSGQFWVLDPQGDGWVRLTTEFLGPGQCLTANVFAEGRPGVSMQPCAPVVDPAQHWQIRRARPGFRRFVTAASPDDLCLDVTNGGPFDRFATLAPCRNYSGQHCRIGGTGRRTR